MSKWINTAQNVWTIENKAIRGTASIVYKNGTYHHRINLPNEGEAGRYDTLQEAMDRCELKCKIKRDPQTALFP